MLKQGLSTLAFLLCADASMAQDAKLGGELFQDRCATCHGIEATGQGPMAGVLVIKPTNLTLLAANNSGEFPTARVAARIDGRDLLVSHGSPMPVYGYFFEGEDTAIKAPSGQPIMTSVPIADLVAYLKSIQID